MDGTSVTPGTVQRYTMSRTTLDGQGSRRMDGTSVTPGTVQRYTMSETTLDGWVKVVLGQTDGIGQYQQMVH